MVQGPPSRGPEGPARSTTARVGLGQATREFGCWVAALYVVLWQSRHSTNKMPRGLLRSEPWLRWDSRRKALRRGGGQQASGQPARRRGRGRWTSRCGGVDCERAAAGRGRTPAGLRSARPVPATCVLGLAAAAKAVQPGPPRVRGGQSWPGADGGGWTPFRSGRPRPGCHSR